MPNNFTSAQTKLVANTILKGFESESVLINSVETQLLNEGGISEPEYGGEISFQRPMQFKAVETANGDISATTPNDLIWGKATGTVQNVITVEVQVNALDQAIKARQLEKHLRPAYIELATRVDANLGAYMVKNAGVTIGTVGTPISSWEHVSNAKAFASSLGYPAGDLQYLVNPYSMAKLAGLQQGVANMPNTLVQSAWEKARVRSPVAGTELTSTDSLPNYTSGVLAGASGTLSATPDATYVTHKDTMIQTIALTGLTASTANALRPGDTIEWTGTGASARSHINIKNRQVFTDGAGAPVKFRQTVVTGATTTAGGVATITVTPPAIFENGQYDNISAPLTAGDAFSIRGTASTVYKPNLAFHKQAFGIGFVDMPKLYATDTVVTNEQGISIRVSRGSDIRGNKNIMRIDVVPAFITFNPMLGMRAWGG